MEEKEGAAQCAAKVNTEAEAMSVGQYIVVFLLLAIPLVNIILLFVWSFGSNANPNKKNFARASLIIFVIFAVLWLIGGAALSGIIMKMSRGY